MNRHGTWSVPRFPGHLPECGTSVLIRMALRAILVAPFLVSSTITASLTPHALVSEERSGRDALRPFPIARSGSVYGRSAMIAVTSSIARTQSEVLRLRSSMRSRVRVRSSRRFRVKTGSW